MRSQIRFRDGFCRGTGKKRWRDHGEARLSGPCLETEDALLLGHCCSSLITPNR